MSSVHEPVNISFAGCGFLGIYHIGAASCIKQHAPHLLQNKILGASIGALAGACLIADVPLGTFTNDFLRLIYEIRKYPLGAFNPLVSVQDMLRDIIIKRMPKDAYKKANGRLIISVTRMSDRKNVLMSNFENEEHFVNALLASACVPFFSTLQPPKIGKHRYVDGGFSNNLPILNDRTITVSPFCGESDICPRDSSLQLCHINLFNTSIEVSASNVHRFMRILHPPGPEVLYKMCQQGYDDALRFLQRNKLITCINCMTIQQTIVLPYPRRHDASDTETWDPECEECIKKAVSSDLPEAVLSTLESAIERTNTEIVGWFRSLRNTRIISLITLPYLLTFDAIRALLKK